VKQYQKLFELEDVRLTIEKEALRAIAQKGIKRGTGARGLRAILEEMMTEIMFELPSRDDVREVAIKRECVTTGPAPLLVTERPRQKKESLTDAIFRGSFPRADVSLDPPLPEVAFVAAPTPASRASSTPSSAGASPRPRARPARPARSTSFK